MLDSIKTFFARRIGADTTDSEPGQMQSGPSPIQLAACALLLELAYADDEFTPAERAHIQSALRRHFALDEATARELMELAEIERLEAVDHYQFARTISQHYDLGQKMVLAEVM
ncbi:MAG: TerB family tellurite resistance protein, partial [bacterium]